MRRERWRAEGREMDATSAIRTDAICNQLNMPASYCLLDKKSFVWKITDDDKWIYSDNPKGERLDPGQLPTKRIICEYKGHLFQVLGNLTDS